MGLWAAILALVVVVAPNTRFFSTEEMVKTLLGFNDASCSDLEPLWLMAQSVPSAPLIPCVQLLPVGWKSRR